MHHILFTLSLASSQGPTLSIFVLSVSLLPILLHIKDKYVIVVNKPKNTTTISFFIKISSKVQKLREKIFRIADPFEKNINRIYIFPTLIFSTDDDRK